MIPYGRQDISQDDIAAVVEVLQSSNLTQGSAVPAFEKAVLDVCGADFAFAVNSATSALHLACLALELGRGDYLWTTPNTFVASANCGLYCGAEVDFVDIDSATYNLCPQKLKEKLLQAKSENKLPKIVVAVHFAGQSCAMQEIFQLSQEFGFKIIEDASHAIGGRYLDEPIGSCRFSDITVFSFHPVKIVTTGEGGMAVTNNPKLAEKMGLLRSHGITRDAHLMTEEMHGPWYYQQVDLGFNYRMTDIQAALGVSQMTRLQDFVVRRNELAERYNQIFLADFNNELAQLLELPVQSPDCFSAFHLYVIRLKLDGTRLSHKEVFKSLRAAGILVNLHYIPVHTQPYYQKMGFKWGDFPQAEKYYQEAISLPLFPTLTYAEQDFVVQELQKALQI